MRISSRARGDFATKRPFSATDTSPRSNSVVGSGTGRDPFWSWLGERNLIPPYARPPLSGVRFRWRDDIRRVPAVGTGWIAVFHVPVAGYALVYLQSTLARLLLLVIPAILLGAITLYEIWQDRMQSTEP